MTATSTTSTVTVRYRLPTAAASYEDDRRAVNADLSDFTASELWAEATTVSATLAHVTMQEHAGRRSLPAVYAGPWRFEARDWLRCRLDAVTAERRRRELTTVDQTGRNDLS